MKLILKSVGCISQKIYSQFEMAKSTYTFFYALNHIVNMETESEFNKIPMNWYSLYLMSNVQHLEEAYKKSDFCLLYEDLYSEVSEKIKFLNEKSHLIITRYGLNLRCLEKLKARIFKESIKSKQIEKFLKIDRFIKYKQVDACVRQHSKEETSLENRSIIDILIPWKSSSSKKEKVVQDV